MSFIIQTISSPRVSFNEGFKAVFGFALLSITLVGAAVGLFSTATLSFGLGVICGMCGGSIGFIVANAIKRSDSAR